MRKQILIAVFLVAILASFVVSASWWDNLRGSSVTGNAILRSNVRTCQDDDGTVTYTYRTTWGAISTRTASDSCSNNVLTDYSCSRSGDRLNVNRDSIACTNGCNTAGTSCVSDEDIAVDNRVCDESDATSGSNPAIAGFIKGNDEFDTTFELADSCVNDKLTEWSCTEDKIPVKTTLNCVKTGTGKCNNTASVVFQGVTKTAGYCQPQTLQCSDSDNGNNITGTGVAVAVVDATGRTETGRDKCLDNKRLKEYYCNTTSSRITSETITCVDVCQNGKCVDRNVLCLDSDGGKIFQTKGTVTNQVGANLTDACMGTTTLLEFSCTSKAGEALGSSRSRYMISSYYKKCKNGCLDGACKPSASGEADNADDATTAAPTEG